MTPLARGRASYTVARAAEPARVRYEHFRRSGRRAASVGGGLDAARHGVAGLRRRGTRATPMRRSRVVDARELVLTWWCPASVGKAAGGSPQNPRARRAAADRGAGRGGGAGAHAPSVCSVGWDPAATAEFLRLLAVRVAAGQRPGAPPDPELSEPGIPDRTAALLRGDDATPLLPIRQALFTRCRLGRGAARGALQHRARLHRSIPQPTAGAPGAHRGRRACGPPRSPVPTGLVDGDRGTVAGGIYQRYAQHRGYRLLLPDEALQQRIHAATVLVKANRLRRPRDPGFGGPRAAAHSVPAGDQRLYRTPARHAHSGLPAEFQVSSVDALASACAHALHPHRGPVPALLSRRPRRAVAGSGSGSTSDPPRKDTMTPHACRRNAAAARDGRRLRPRAKVAPVIAEYLSTRGVSHELVAAMGRMGLVRTALRGTLRRHGRGCVHPVSGHRGTGQSGLLVAVALPRA